jgi:phosphonate transport system permease protein
VSLEAPAAQTRPIPPRRASSMALASAVATAAFVIGAATASVGDDLPSSAFIRLIPAGVLWGLVATVGLVAAMKMGRVEFSRTDVAALAAGMVASAVLAVRVLPDTPQTVDVLLCIRFAAAWLPAGLAAGFVVSKHRARPSSVVNTVVMWLVGGAFAIPAAETLGVIRPIESLRRGLEPEFGRGDYVIVALVIAALGIATFLSVATRLPGLATASAVLLLTAFAGSAVGFTIPGLIANIRAIVDIPNFWPPDFTWAIGDGNWWWIPSWEFGAPTRSNPAVETIRIAIVATVIGCGIALPLSFLASTLTSPNRPTYLTAKAFMNVTRTIPDLFWASLFVVAIGLGPFAGAIALTIFAMAIMSKLLSETIDTADPGPLEAAKASGSRHFPAIRTSVLPQVLPSYVSYGLYIFELNIRASAVLGLVGAGGIGRVIETQRGFFRFDRVLAIIIVIFIVVFVLERISMTLRRRLV